MNINPTIFYLNFPFKAIEASFHLMLIYHYLVKKEISDQMFYYEIFNQPEYFIINQ